MPIRRVIVGVDGSMSSSVALEWAVAEAARVGCVLVIVHVARHAAPVFPGRQRVSIPGGDPTLARAVGFARDRLEPARIQPVLRTGPPADALVELAYAEDVLVLGAPAPGHRWVRTSTTYQVIMRASCPVVIVRIASAITGRPVVVGVDRPALAGGALRFGFAFAARNLLPLTVILNAGESERGLRTSAEALARQYPQVAVEWLVESGPAVSLLASASASAALVVVTVKGNGPGPLVRGLIGQARCPVATTTSARMM